MAVNAARLAVAAPWVVLLMLGAQSNAVRTFDSSGGMILLVVGGAVCFAAYRLMLRIGSLPPEPRVLR
jgi:tight adherence protein B